MRLRVFILVAAATLTGWKGYCPFRADVSSGGLLESSPAEMLGQQSTVDAANREWQRQQVVLAAQKAAQTAASYARYAASFGNDQARQADRLATEAARYADVAAGRVSALTVGEVGQPPISLEAAAGYATKDAALAKQAAQQSEVDFNVSLLEKERDAKILPFYEKYNPETEPLSLRTAALKEQCLKLTKQLSDSEDTNAPLRTEQLFPPKNPIRILDGAVCSVAEIGWMGFSGAVTEVRSNGILIHGDFGPPLEAIPKEHDYFVENFPTHTYPVAAGKTITPDMGMVAHLSEKEPTYQFANPAIDFKTTIVSRLDYGKIMAGLPPEVAQNWNKPVLGTTASDLAISNQLAVFHLEISNIRDKFLQVTAERDKEIAPIEAEYEAKIADVPKVLAKQAAKMEEAKKQALTDKVLKNNQDLADKGDPYGLLRMGERYRDGAGVTRDRARAKDYLQKAVAAGEPSAAAELKNLPAN